MRAPVGAANLANREFGIGRGLCAVTPIKLDPGFLWFLAPLLKDSLRQVAVGSTYEAVTVQDVRDLVVPVPPIEEQARIAEFLADETARIDRLLALTHRRLALLQEREAAEITAAVSGAMPITRTALMYLVDPTRPVMYGIILPGPNVPDGVTLVKGGDVEAGRLRPELLSRTAREIEAPYARARLRAGDLLVSIRGSFGAVARVPPELEEANITQDAARVAPRDGVVGRWLFYALRSSHAYSQMAERATGATIRGVNIRDLKRVTLPLPTPAEQERIAERLDRASGAVEPLKSRLEAQHRLLSERRQALITAAVTGQLDPSSYRRPREFEAA